VWKSAHKTYKNCNKTIMEHKKVYIRLGCINGMEEDY
jgi:hypothetical protein